MTCKRATALAVLALVPDLLAKAKASR